MFEREQSIHHGFAIVAAKIELEWSSLEIWNQLLCKQLNVFSQNFELERLVTDEGSYPSFDEELHKVRLYTS